MKRSIFNNRNDLQNVNSTLNRTLTTTPTPYVLSIPTATEKIDPYPKKNVHVHFKLDPIHFSLEFATMNKS